MSGKFGDLVSAGIGDLCPSRRSSALGSAAANDPDSGGDRLSIEPGLAAKFVVARTGPSQAGRQFGTRDKVSRRGNRLLPSGSLVAVETIERRSRTQL